MINKKFLQRAAAVVAALLVWQAAAMLLNNKILLVTPVTVVARLATIWTEPGFFGTVWFSLWRIAVGFVSALITGVLLAVAAGRFSLLEIFLRPYMVTVKSIPVASFVIIALLWFSSASLSSFISFLIVLPIIYTSVLGGVKSIDVQMLEMAGVFRLPWHTRLIFVWLPQIKPFLISSCSVALGLAWKSGVAAEIIGIPTGSVGESLYNAKIYLNTPDLFAWTVIIVLLSVATEKLFMYLLGRCFAGLERI